MKALAVWRGRQTSGLVEHPEPRLSSPTSVRVRVLEVGVCGTDAEICAYHFGTPPAGGDYLVIGHEAVGEVEAVGAEVTRFRPGDLVVPSVRRPCPHAHCPACRSGNQDFCVTGDFTERGIKEAHGFLAEWIVEEEAYLHRLPEALRPVGVLTEPLSVVEKGLRQLLAAQRRLPWLRGADDAALLQGRRAVVLGAGPVGLLASMLLLRRGCRVWVYSRERQPNPRAALAAAVGAVYVSSTETSFDQLAAEVGAIDLICEAAGSARLSFEALEWLGPAGGALLIGAAGGPARIEVRGDHLLTRMVVENQLVVGTVNAHADDFAAAIDDLLDFHTTWPEALAGLITGRHDMERFCPCATERGGIKDIIVLQPTSNG